MKGILLEVDESTAHSSSSQEVGLMTAEALHLTDTKSGAIELAVGRAYVADLHQAWQIMYDLHQVSLGQPTGFRPASQFNASADDAFLMHSNALTSVLAQLTAFGPEASATALGSLIDFGEMHESLAGLGSLYLAAMMGSQHMADGELQDRAGRLWNEHGFRGGVLDAGVGQAVLANPLTGELRLGTAEQLRGIGDVTASEGPVGAAISWFVQQLPKPVHNVVEEVRNTPVGRVVEGVVKVVGGVAAGGYGIISTIEGGADVIREVGGLFHAGESHPAHHAPPASAPDAPHPPAADSPQQKQMHEYLQSMGWIVMGATKQAVDTFGGPRSDPSAPSPDRDLPHPNLCPPGDESYVGPPVGSHPQPMPIPRGRGLDAIVAAAAEDFSLEGCFPDPDDIAEFAGRPDTPGQLFGDYEAPVLQEYVITRDGSNRLQARPGSGAEAYVVYVNTREVRIYQNRREVLTLSRSDPAAARVIVPQAEVGQALPAGPREYMAALLTELHLLGQIP
ncbi:hypothetical protein ACFV80_43170 [Streptomyces sp. NPDC059862]|uniref:hypothetical protein n=1 Tax=Streptomyces sp. NPDC059862 TaxID=3346975 RepID=UPI00366770AA